MAGFENEDGSSPPFEMKILCAEDSCAGNGTSSVWAATGSRREKTVRAESDLFGGTT